MVDDTLAPSAWLGRLWLAKGRVDNALHATASDRCRFHVRHAPRHRAMNRKGIAPPGLVHGANQVQVEFRTVEEPGTGDSRVPDRRGDPAPAGGCVAHRGLRPTGTALCGSARTGIYPISVNAEWTRFVRLQLRLQAPARTPMNNRRAAPKETKAQVTALLSGGAGEGV